MERKMARTLTIVLFCALTVLLAVFFSYKNSRYYIKKGILCDPDENIPLNVACISTRFVKQNKKVQKSI
jgi:hypothetical protein